MATSDNVGRIAIYDTEALELRRIVRLPDEGGSPIAMSPDGREIVHIAGNFDDLAGIHLDGGRISPFPVSPRGNELPRHTSFHLSSGGPRSSSRSSSEGSERPSVVRRDACTGRELAARSLDVANPEWVKASEGTLVLASAEPAVLTILDPETLRTRAATVDAGLSFDVSPDGDSIATGGFDGTVTLYDVSSRKRTVLDGRHAGAVTDGFIDGSTLVTTGDDRDDRVDSARGR